MTDILLFVQSLRSLKWDVYFAMHPAVDAGSRVGVHRTRLEQARKHFIKTRKPVRACVADAESVKTIHDLNKSRAACLVLCARYFAVADKVLK